MSAAYKIYQIRNGVPCEIYQKAEALDRWGPGDNFMAETIAQVQAISKLKRLMEHRSIAFGNATLLTDSQSVLLSLNSAKPNYHVTALLQRELVDLKETWMKQDPLFATYSVSLQHDKDCYYKTHSNRMQTCPKP